MHSRFSHIKLLNKPRGEALGILKGLASGLAVCILFLMPSIASAGTIRKPPNNLGLVAYWSFNEGTSTVATDFSGNGHTGTLAGTGTSPLWANGKQGKSLDFSGTGGGTKRIKISALNVTTTHTVSMWIYATADCTNYGALFASDGDTGLYCLVSGAGNNRIYYYPYEFSNTNISLNQWHHIAVTSDAGSVIFYLDGVANGTYAPATPAYSATAIGNDSSGESFPGKIDETRVYSRALSATEIANLYKSSTAKIKSSLPATTVNKTRTPAGSLQTGLVGHFTFDGKDMYSNVADVSGNGNNGTLSGFTSTTTTIGKIGQALNFDGTDDYVDLGDNAVFEPSGASGALSVSFWYKGLKGSIENFISHSPSNGTSHWHIDESDATVCGGTSCATTRTVSYTLPSDNGWHHLVMTLDPSTNPDTLMVYLDGASTGTVSGSRNGGGSTWGTNTRIGAPWWGTSGYRQGPMDDVRIYNRALSAAEAKQLYLLGK